jgi:membrane-bound serine protease (ClpP class)
MTLPERLLHTLADPNIAYLLMTLGAIGIIAELYSPGTLVPGITGAIALVLAFMGLGTLPTNWAGVLLLLLAFGLLAAELLTAGVGILAVGGVLAFVLGSMLLFVPFAPASPTLPEVRVHPGLIAGMTAVLVGFVFVVLRALLQARRAPVLTGAQTLIGRIGVAASDLTPAGTVQVDSELWSAVAADRGIRAGAAVRVVDVEGVTLQVEQPR